MSQKDQSPDSGLFVRQRGLVMPFLAGEQSFPGLAMQFTDLELPPWGALNNCI